MNLHHVRSDSNESVGKNMAGISHSPAGVNSCPPSSDPNEVNYSSCTPTVRQNAPSQFVSTQKRLGSGQESCHTHGMVATDTDQNENHSGSSSQAPTNRFPSRPWDKGSGAWQKPEHIRVNEVMDLKTICKDGTTVSLDLDAIAANRSKLEKAIVGKLLGRRLPYMTLKNALYRKWSHLGEFQFVLVSQDCFLCIFGTMKARDAVLKGGPWTVEGYIVGLDQWTPNFTPKSMQGFTSLIWVRLPHLPLLYWDYQNICRIASMLGQPMWLDAQTSCWGRSIYARVCVRLELTKKLPTGVWIEGVQGRFFQPVEYEGISQLCFQCGIIGHKVDQCPSRPKQQPEAHADLHSNSKEDSGNLPYQSTHGRNAVNATNHEESTDISSRQNGNQQDNIHGSNHASVVDPGTHQPVALAEQAGHNSGPEQQQEKDHGSWVLVSERKNRAKGDTPGSTVEQSSNKHDDKGDVVQQLQFSASINDAGITANHDSSVQEFNTTVQEQHSPSVMTPQLNNGDVNLNADGGTDHSVDSSPIFSFQGPLIFALGELGPINNRRSSNSYITPSQEARKERVLRAHLDKKLW